MVSNVKKWMAAYRADVFWLLFVILSVFTVKKWITSHQKLLVQHFQQEVLICLRILAVLLLISGFLEDVA